MHAIWFMLCSPKIAKEIKGDGELNKHAIPMCEYYYDVHKLKC
jgi:hypothetical protein